MHTRTLERDEVAGDRWWMTLLRRVVVEAPARPRPAVTAEGDDVPAGEQALLAPIFLDGQMW